MQAGLIAALTGLRTAEKGLETVAHNLANVTTPGYRPQHVLVEGFQNIFFRELQGAGNMSWGANASKTWQSSRAGALTQTGQPLDAAVQGDGWFVVQTPEGERYTRVGRFHLDAQGRLVNSQGHGVMGEDGPIEGLTAPAHLTASGFVRGSDGTAVRLDLRDVDGASMSPQGGGLYRAADGGDQGPANVTLTPGMLEQSGVNAQEEMMDLILWTRLAEAGQKSVRSIDAANETLIRAARL